MSHAAFAKFAAAHREIRGAALSAVESAMVLRLCRTTIDLRTVHRQGDAAPSGLEAIAAAMCGDADLSALDDATLEGACGACETMAQAARAELARRISSRHAATAEAAR